MSQLTINRLPFPTELLSIIKDYSLSTVERHKIIIIKKQICKLIIEGFGANRRIQNYYNYNYTNHLSFNIFFFEKNTIYHRYYIEFCQHCGNYTNRNIHICCRCEN